MQKGQAYNVTKDIIIYHLPFAITRFRSNCLKYGVVTSKVVLRYAGFKELEIGTVVLGTI